MLGKRARSPGIELSTHKRLAHELGTYIEPQEDIIDQKFWEIADHWVRKKQSGDLLISICLETPRKVLTSGILLKEFIKQIDAAEWDCNVRAAAICLARITEVCNDEELNYLLDISASTINLLDILTKNVVLTQSPQLRECCIKVLGNCLKHADSRLTFVEMGCLRLLMSMVEIQRVPMGLIHEIWGELEIPSVH